MSNKKQDPYSSLLVDSGIHLNVTASSKEEAVTMCGAALIELGAVSQEYAIAMWERELIASSYLGNSVAMPHGTDESRVHVNFGQIVFLRFSKPFNWDDELVKICIGIAAQGDEHVDILGFLAEAILDDEKFDILLNTDNRENVRNILVPNIQSEESLIQ